MSFFEKNCAALAKKPEHEGLVEALRATPVNADGGISVYETETKDLTLAYNNKAVHALSGAQAEARQLVDRQLNTNQYGQNVIVGFGLGYVAQEALRQIEANKQTGNLVILEPQLNLLRFVLEHVDVSHVLGHPQCYVQYEHEPCVQFIMKHYIQGDGLGLLFTSGYMQLMDEAAVKVLGRLKTLVETNQLNTFLLQGRGKEWTQEFLRNIPLLPKAKPVTCLSWLFKDLPVVLVSAGPSVDEQIEALKAIQDKVVVMAIGGAVRTLLKHGVTPDFVTFMDSVGPSKHLFGLEAPLKNSQVIVGPSAEAFVFSQPCKALWLAGQHFNEQFTKLLDKAYDTTLTRFQTGGTVSMFNFQIAAELGFQHFILLGQDLALRGDQFYAGGVKGKIDRTTMKISMTESEDTTFRDVPLVEIEGQNGEKLLTQQDYAHFLTHFNKMGELIHNQVKEGLRDETKLINTSIGGAYLEGYEHHPMSAVPDLIDLKPINKEALFASRQEEAEQWQEQAIREQFYDTVGEVLDEIRLCVKDAKAALQVLQTKLLARTPDKWEQPSQRYSELFNAFSERLEASEFLHDTYYHEQLALRHHYKQTPEGVEEIRANFTLDEQYLTMMIENLSKHMAPELEDARRLLAPDFAQAASSTVAG